MNLREKLPITLENDITDFIKSCAQKEHSESNLITILHKVQGRHGFLSKQHLQEVAELLGVPAATVTGVATFYHFFRLTPQGKYKISICLGTACYVKGAESVMEAFKEILGISEGESTTDGMFTLEQTRCLGVCGLAPVAMINDKVYGKLNAGMVEGIIKKIRDEDKISQE